MTADSDPSAVSVPSPFAENVSSAGRRVFRSGFWQVANGITPYFFTMFVSIVAARVLGPSGMGQQSFIAFILLTTATLCSAGFPAAVPRYVGELIGRGREGALPALASWSWRVEFFAGLLGAIAMLIVVAVGGTPRAAWIFGAVIVLAGVLHKVPGSILSGAQHWRQNSIVVLVTGAVAAVATIITLLAGGGITGIFVVGACANIVMLLWASVLAHRMLARIEAPRERLGALGRRILRFAAVASIPMVLSFVVYQRSEFFFLKHDSSDTQIALYSIAFSAYAALLALPSALANMITPAVATLFGAGASDRIRAGYARSVRLVLLVSIPLAAGALVLGPTLLRLLFGEQYAATGNILIVLLIAFVFSPVGTLSSNVLIGCGRIRVPVFSTSISAGIDVGLAALLVPRMDAMGAAVANVSAQLAAVAISTWFAVRLVAGIELSAGHLARTVIAAAAAAGCAWLVLLLGHGPGILLLATVVGSAIFVALAVILRIVTREDVDWIASALGGRAGGRLSWIYERFQAPLWARR